MLVRDRMTPNPTTVRPDSDPMAAQTLLRYGGFGRLPVVDQDGTLVGIVSASDLELFFSRAPSPGVLKRQFRVDQVMKSPVLTVPPDFPLEEAARLMLQHKVYGLPVMEDGELIGIITGNDIFAELVEALGGDSHSLRVTVEMSDRIGQLARVAARLAKLDCNIRSVLSSSSAGKFTITMRLEGAERDDIVQALRELEGTTVLNVWPNDQGAFK